MDFRRRPPTWLTDLLPLLGDRRAREAWREWFEDTYIIDFVTGVTAGKVLETLVVMVAPVLVGDPVAWEETGALILYFLLTLASFIVSIFGWHLRRVSKGAAETVEESAEAVGDAAEAVGETVEEAVDGEE